MRSLKIPKHLPQTTEPSNRLKYIIITTLLKFIMKLLSPQYTHSFSTFSFFIMFNTNI
jgi:hypothetical protein